MTREERQRKLARAARLEAEARAIRREEQAFWREVEDRLDEVKERFGLSDNCGKDAPPDESVAGWYGDTIEGTQGSAEGE